MSPEPQSDVPAAGKGQKAVWIAVLSLLGIFLSLGLRFGMESSPEVWRAPLLVILVLGGSPLVLDLARKALAREFGSDLLGGISILTSVLLGEYLAGSIIVLMLSGGEALEAYALRSASSVLEALARRMPSVAHRHAAGGLEDISLDQVRVGDELELYPHDICPVDGVVLEGHGVMDESYLTGEPFEMTKTAGSQVLSGAVNGGSALRIRAVRPASDSRYARIMEVMRESESMRPRMRRLGDRLGAVYTPLALLVAASAWAYSGEPMRFLAVLVIATPCPLLIGIPVAIIGSISLCARRAIIVKSPSALEQVSNCHTAIFDKTGTLTYGEPKLVDQWVEEGREAREVLALAASLERYSKHPLARAVLEAARGEGVELLEAAQVAEPPGRGLEGEVAGHSVRVTGRKHLEASLELPEAKGGLECGVLIDGKLAALYRFRDAPRMESRSFVGHLGSRHHIDHVMLVSGDRESEVQYLAGQVGIREVHADQSPEEKLALVRRETGQSPTLYVGDGINDAPAMMAATVGIAIGQNSDVTAEAADVVILDNTLEKVDEFLHVSLRMRTIALQSAVGGMLLSLVGMAFAAAGHLSPVTGAMLQEMIDVMAVLNALRAAWPPRILHHELDDRS